MGRPKGSKARSVHTWTEDEKEYLKKITIGRHYKEIVELMNKKFEHNFTQQQVKGAIARYKLNTGFTGYFKPGDIPINKGTKGLTQANKTSFKTGNKPMNHRAVGSERINVDGYVEIKIKEPNKWIHKHKLIWEKYNGSVPSGHAVIFGDGNKSNLDISNLILVSRKQLLTMNKNKLIKENSQLTKTGVVIADLIIKIGELQTKE